MQISTHVTGLARLWESTYETPANLSKNRTEFLAKVAEGLYPSVPGPISAAIAAMDRLVEIERQASGGVEAYCRSVVDGLTEAGKDLPKDFAAGAVKARELGEQQETTRIATRIVREELDVRFPQIVEDNLAGVLAGLRSEVGEILARLPELIKTLNGLDVASPAAAAQADQKQREALVALNEDCRRYNELRDCQVAAIRATTLAKQMMTRNDRPGALGPVWEDAWAQGLLEFADIRLKGNLAAGDDVLRFSRLARREDVWVPDLHDVQDALDALHPVGAA